MVGPGLQDLYSKAVSRHPTTEAQALGLELNRRDLNVLRRLLNRADFKPLDVARLGLARLESAPGLGESYLSTVLFQHLEAFSIEP